MDNRSRTTNLCHRPAKTAINQSLTQHMHTCQSEPGPLTYGPTLQPLSHHWLKLGRKTSQIPLCKCMSPLTHRPPKIKNCGHNACLAICTIWVQKWRPLIAFLSSRNLRFYLPTLHHYTHCCISWLGKSLPRTGPPSVLLELRAAVVSPTASESPRRARLLLHCAVLTGSEALWGEINKHCNILRKMQQSTTLTYTYRDRERYGSNSSMYERLLITGL